MGSALVKWVQHTATAMLIVGYLIHALNFHIMNLQKMCLAMILFAAAMYFLFV